MIKSDLMRTRTRILPFITALFCLGGAAYGRSAGPRFQHAFPNRFLPQNFVYSIAFDHRDLLWVGTLEGIGEWDGEAMRVYRSDPQDTNSLPSNSVQRIFEDSRGWLWVSTSGGWARLSPNRSVIIRVGCNGGIMRDRQGNVWCATDSSLERFDYGRNLFIQRGAIRFPVTPRNIWTDPDGTIWIFGKNGRLYSSSESGAGWKEMTLEPISVQDISLGLRIGAHVYLLSTSRGVYEWNTGSSVLQRPRGQLSKLSDESILDYGVSSDGFIWIATRGAVYRYDPKTGACQKAVFAMSRHAAAQDIVFSICVNAEGIVWVGTIWGVFEYDPFERGFDNIHLSSNDSRSQVMVLSMVKDGGGTLWVGTYGRGLYEYDATSDKFRAISHKTNDPSTSLSNDVVWAIGLDNEQHLWVGTDDGLNVLTDRKKFLFKHFKFGRQVSSPGVNTVTAFARDGEGRLWGATYSGELFITDIKTGYKLYRKLRLHIPIRSLYFEGDSVIWLGTVKDLIRYDRKNRSIDRFTLPGGARGETVWCVTQVGSSLFYLGTSKGLDKFNYTRRIFEFFGTEAGLPASNVFSVLRGEGSDLWCSTNRGLVRFNDHLSPDRRIQIYNENDGLANLEFNRGAYFRSQSGTLYFGGNNGITEVHPSEIVDMSQPPHTIIKSVTIALPEREYVVPFPVDTLSLSYSNLTLAIHFVAPYWTDPKDVTYYCRLSSVDRSWVSLKDQKRVQYTHLPPGNYVFSVRAVSPDGISDRNSASLVIIVPPPYWDTLWFKMVAAVLGLGLLVAIVRAMFVRTYKKRLLIMQIQRDILDKERTRFSRDIHDEIGAGLTEIAILSELSRKDAEIPVSTSGQIGQVAELARSLVDKLSEIVWSINPQHDTLEQFVSYLREYSHRYLENANISIRWATPAEIPVVKVSSVARRNLLLLFKEALANAVKHSDCDSLEIGLGLKDGNMEMWVYDNGNGFDRWNNFRHGLQNMCDRAAEIGGVCKIESAQGKGTRVFIKVPVSKLSMN